MSSQYHHIRRYMYVFLSEFAFSTVSPHRDERKLLSLVICDFNLCSFYALYHRTNGSFVTWWDHPLNSILTPIIGDVGLYSVIVLPKLNGKRLPLLLNWKHSGKLKFNWRSLTCESKTAAEMRGQNHECYCCCLLVGAGVNLTVPSSRCSCKFYWRHSMLISQITLTINKAKANGKQKTQRSGAMDDDDALNACKTHKFIDRLNANHAKRPIHYRHHQLSQPS